MESLQKILDEAHIPELVRLLDKGDECWLVGGALRDWVLGRTVSDFDFATPYDPTPLARRLARAIGGSWFPLDPQRQQSRVISGKGRAATYDFAPFRGPDIESDLRGRDFTVNALALRVGVGYSDTIFDPLNGLEDLSERRLRACSAGAFRDDPLRILRGVRHAVILGLDFEQATADWMREAVHQLPRVAPERIRNELSQIIAAAPVSRTIALLHSFMLLSELFGPPASGEAVKEGVHLASGMESALATMESIEPEIRALCVESLDDGFSRSSLIRLAGFLRCYAPPDRQMLLAERLRLSRRNRERLQHLLALPATLAKEFEDLQAGRARALWTEDLGIAAVESLLFLGALDGTLAAKPHMLLQALQDLQAEGGGGRIPSLVNGAWLQEQLGIGEGPAMGILLEELRRAEIAGRVKSRAEAEAFLRERRNKS